jgi:16S rRNA (guanine527-N7)-methyltransferase
MIADEAAARSWLEHYPRWNAETAERLELLVRLLGEENARQNLVSVASLAEVWRRHIADSAQLLSHVPRETSAPWFDLGAGAGFPGLVIAALRPDLPVTLVESRGRRVEWLERARLALGLERVEVAGVKLEALPSRPYSVISARAFAPLPKLLELSARFSTSTTRFLLPKGRSAQQELDQLSGWRHMFHVEQSLTDPEAGIIVGQLLGRKGKQS